MVCAGLAFSILARERARLVEETAKLESDTTEAWDHLIYRFSTTYDAFYETWEDIEDQFENIGRQGRD